MGDGRRVATGREKTSSHQEDEWRLQTLARQHGIRKDRETDAIGKLFAAFVWRADEGTLSRLLVEATILLAAARTNPAVVLRDAAATYKVDRWRPVRGKDPGRCSSNRRPILCGRHDLQAPPAFQSPNKAVLVDCCLRHRDAVDTPEQRAYSGTPVDVYRTGGSVLTTAVSVISIIGE